MLTFTFHHQNYIVIHYLSFPLCEDKINVLCMSSNPSYTECRIMDGWTMRVVAIENGRCDVITTVDISQVHVQIMPLLWEQS